MIANPEQSDFDPKWMCLDESMPEDGSQLIEDLMRFLPDGMTANSWAVRAGVSRTVWTDIRRHGNPSRRTLEKLLTAVGCSLAEFEALRVGKVSSLAALAPLAGVSDASHGPWRAAPLAPIPLFETIAAGEWGEPGLAFEQIALSDRISGWLPRPISLAADSEAYAVVLAGQSMWPRFRTGRRLFISPGAPVAIGDDVLLRLAIPNDQAGGHPVLVLVKELTGRTVSALELRQFNPDATFAVDASQVAAIHKVIGEAI